MIESLNNFIMQNNKQNQLRELLKRLRNEAGLTQTDLAQKLQKPQSFISKYENGEKTLDFVEIFDICKALGISLSSFSNQFESECNES